MPYPWAQIAAELRTNEQARIETANALQVLVPREKLIRWRRRDQDPFPGPVLVVPVAGGGGAGQCELWSVTDIHAWIKRQQEENKP